MLPHFLWVRSAVLLINIIVDPGREAVEAQLVVFPNSVSDGKTPYQGPPTQENERKWEELYHGASAYCSCIFILFWIFEPDTAFGVIALFSRITRDDAHTTPTNPVAAGDAGDYDQHDLSRLKMPPRPAHLFIAFSRPGLEQYQQPIHAIYQPRGKALATTAAAERRGSGRLHRFAATVSHVLRGHCPKYLPAQS